LHPSGEMNPDTYSLIGGAYKEVESKEPWLTGVQHAARIALVSAEQNQASARGHHNSATFADEGVARMLLELHLPFVILDEQADWKPFELVILPDSLVLNALLLKKAQNHLKSGGRILAAGGALLTAEQDDFAVNPGAEFKGRSAFDPDYLLATALSDSVPVRSPIVIAGGAYEISPAGKTGVLAERRIPYFNRTWEHFCSHQHAPDSPAKPNPAAIISDQIAYFAHNIFTQYRATGQPLYRDFILATLKQLFPEGLPVETNLPTVARFNLLEQQTEGRYVAHLLYAPITLRAQTGSGSQSKPMEIIEDLIPLHERSVTLRLKQKIRAVNLAPTGQCINFEQTGDRVTFNVAKFTCHQMVVLSYRD